MIEVGKMIATIRKERGYSQQQLANKLGIPSKLSVIMSAEQENRIMLPLKPLRTSLMSQYPC